MRPDSVRGRKVSSTVTAVSVVLLTVTGVAGHPSATDKVIWRDEFTSLRRYERRPSHAWRPGGEVVVRDTLATLIPPLPPVDRGAVTIERTIEQRKGTGYIHAGAALLHGPGNKWHLLLVEGPDGNRYIELSEELDGVSHAQAGAASVPSLPVAESGDMRTWQYGRRYSLTLRILPSGIEGVVRDAETGATWRRSYRFDAARAVRSGRPAVIAAGISGHLHRFLVKSTASTMPGDPRVARETGYVVIVNDRAGVVGPRLAVAFSRAGLRAKVLGWQELDRQEPTVTGAAILVLADARDLPVQARDAVMRALSTGGRVIAIGAPAAMRLLAMSAEGWTDRDGWNQARARSLRRTPLRIEPSQWKRNAFETSHRATIQQEARGCWRIETDLLGWDTWYADVAGAFGSDRNLLVFEAKGDATTSHLAVECVERDGSRWIATVPLSTQWRWYVLGPADFPYWSDSPTKNRGGPGDRFHPDKIARVSFGLSGSHTPRVKPGRHVYWLRSLSTSVDPRGGLPDFSLPDVEILWPSYKLYAVDNVVDLRTASEQGVVRWNQAVAWRGAACSPVWRERGRGFRRGRAWRWVPVLEAYDREGRKRGALLSVMLGDCTSPNAMWANLAITDPARQLDAHLLSAVTATARAMLRGIWLLEGGSEFFSYRSGETVLLGAKVLNAGSQRRTVTVRLRVTDAQGRTAFEATRSVVVPGSEAPEVSWQWRPRALDSRGYTVTTTLDVAGQTIDRIVHRIETLRSTPPRPDEFVRVKGSMFMLGDKPWYFRGVNYWPTWMAGYPNLNQRSRECYDPEIIERDLMWMEAAGINVVSAIAAIQPPDPDDPAGYRDQLDFVERCLRHGIRCYFTLPNARPYAGADFAKVKEYIEKAGLHNHPGIMAWELAWEPIEGAWGKDLQKFQADWNRWIEEQYSSVSRAVEDWGFDPRSDKGAPVPVPTHQQCTQAGPWNRYVAAFSRAFSDLISRAYGRIVRPLRAWDPNHLISFRGGACGIPSGGVFAHIHSVGVARHLDFLCPEGYNLQTNGWAMPTPPDDIRKGGLVTAYYRAVSREKPIVWMEFGFTVNGMGEGWSQNRYRVRRAELENQRVEFQRFYQMMVESGARGAAPWWLPGGFRLDEKSDFGLLEPDGTERPACTVLKEYLPVFARVRSATDPEWLTVDPDTERYHAWTIYSDQYLQLLKQGRDVAVRFPDSGRDSGTEPECSITGGPLDRWHLPPRGLNAEFDSLELRVGDGPWVPIDGGEVLDVPRGASILCRAVVANTGTMTWNAQSGVALLPMSGGSFGATIPENVPPMGTVALGPVTLQPSATDEGRLTLRMARRNMGFGEARTVTIRLK